MGNHVDILSILAPPSLAVPHCVNYIIDKAISDIERQCSGNRHHRRPRSSCSVSPITDSPSESMTYSRNYRGRSEGEHRILHAPVGEAWWQDEDIVSRPSIGVNNTLTQMSAIKRVLLVYAGYSPQQLG